MFENIRYTGSKEVSNDGILLIVSPNPSAGLFTIITLEETYSAAVTNLLGEKILFQTIGHSIPSEKPGQVIDLSTQPDGIYFLCLQTKQGIVVKKLAVSK